MKLPSKAPIAKSAAAIKTPAKKEKQVGGGDRGWGNTIGGRKAAGLQGSSSRVSPKSHGPEGRSSPSKFRRLRKPWHRRHLLQRHLPREQERPLWEPEVLRAMLQHKGMKKEKQKSKATVALG